MIWAGFISLYVFLHLTLFCLFILHTYHFYINAALVFLMTAHGTVSLLEEHWINLNKFSKYSPSSFTVKKQCSRISDIGNSPSLKETCFNTCVPPSLSSRIQNDSWFRSWNQTGSQLSNLWWIPNSVCVGFGPAMKMGSSRWYPTTFMWVSSRLPFTVD